MKITAEIVKDSIHNGNRLTTLQLEYPKYIHAEFLTHRLFSRNSSSSRAIPIEKLVSQVEEEMVEPIFMYNQKGMSAKNSVEADDLEEALHIWKLAASDAIHAATSLSELGIHKQIANRLLEPFSTITTLVSSTEWDNFFNLRISEEAQQEIQLLALRIKLAIDESTPTQIDLGNWHLPFILQSEEGLSLRVLKKLSAARCARVSYLNHGANSTHEQDIVLANTLINSGHFSPLEHQATPTPYESNCNFVGWTQFRQKVNVEIV